MEVNPTIPSRLRFNLQLSRHYSRRTINCDVRYLLACFQLRESALLDISENGHECLHAVVGIDVAEIAIRLPGRQNGARMMLLGHGAGDLWCRDVFWYSPEGAWLGLIYRCGRDVEMSG